MNNQTQLAAITKEAKVFENNISLDQGKVIKLSQEYEEAGFPQMSKILKTVANKYKVIDVKGLVD